MHLYKLPLEVSFWILALIIAPFRADAAVSACLGVPDDQNRVIEVCQTANSYIFKLPSGDQTFDRDVMKATIVLKLSNWWAAHRLPAEDFCNSAIDYWVSVPESSPDATAARIILQSGRGPILFSALLNPQEFNPSTANAVTFPNAAYPESYGVRAGSLIAKALPDSTSEAVEGLALAGGALAAASQGGLWYKLTTEPFEEEAVRRRIMLLNGANQVLDRVDTNQIYEWLAHRRHVFSMTIDCDPGTMGVGTHD